MEHRYKYTRDKRSRRITWIVTTLLVLLLGGFQFIWGATYLPAWILLVVFCVAILGVLSMPRYIRLTDELLEIHCIVDLTRIHIEDVELVRKIDPSEFRRLVPLIASCGVGGYFGYYLDLREWKIYKVYTTAKTNLVLIEDIYEDTYLVNCTDPDLFVRETLAARDKKRQEILAQTKNLLPD